MRALNRRVERVFESSGKKTHSPTRFGKSPSPASTIIRTKIAENRSLAQETLGKRSGERLEPPTRTFRLWLRSKLTLPVNDRAGPPTNWRTNHRGGIPAIDSQQVAKRLSSEKRFQLQVDTTPLSVSPFSRASEQKLYVFRRKRLALQNAS